MACCVAAPAWYRSDRPRRRLPETDLQKAEKLRLLETRMKLTDELDNAREYVAETQLKLQKIDDDILPTLEKERTMLLETIVMVVQFRERTIERLANLAAEAEATKDHAKARSTRHVLDMVNERLRDLWQKADKVRDTLLEAHEKRDSFRYNVALAHLKIADVAGQIHRLATWVFMYNPLPQRRDRRANMA